MGRYKRFLLLTGIAVLLSAGCVYAMPGFGSKEEYKDSDTKSDNKRMDRIFDKLQLTAGQKKQLEESRAKNQAGRKVFFDELKKLRRELNAELMKAELDIDKINAIHLKTKELHSKMMDERMSSILEVRKTLTLEQYKKFNKLMEEYKPRHGKFRNDPRRR